MAHVKGKGTILKVTIGASPALTTIPKVRSLTPPGWSREKIDTTDLDSSWMECDSVIPDPGPVNGVLESNPDDTAHADLETIATSGIAVACEVIPPTGGKKFQFNAFVSQWQREQVDQKSIYLINFALQPTGAITVAASS